MACIASQKNVRLLVKGIHAWDGTAIIPNSFLCDDVKCLWAQCMRPALYIHDMIGSFDWRKNMANAETQLGLSYKVYVERIKKYSEIVHKSGSFSIV